MTRRIIAINRRTFCVSAMLAAGSLWRTCHFGLASLFRWDDTKLIQRLINTRTTETVVLPARHLVCRGTLWLPAGVTLFFRRGATANIAILEVNSVLPSRNAWMMFGSSQIFRQSALDHRPKCGDTAIRFEFAKDYDFKAASAEYAKSCVVNSATVHH